MSVPEGRIHIVGAGGAGMSAIARLLLGRGWELSGSDLRGGPSLETLGDLGVAITTGHTPEAVRGAGLVLASSAVPEYDEEIEEAHKSGIPVWRRPEMLAALSADEATIGATGTHGKTTTTSMLITISRRLGMDPSFIVGGDLVEWGTNGHAGQDDLLIVEADEAFRTFESIDLDGLVVTNVEAEHLGHFGTEDDLLDSFVSVVEGVDGVVLACLDDVGSGEVARRTGSITYGTSTDAAWKIRDLVSDRTGVRFNLTSSHGEAGVSVPMPGRHIALNAAGAIALMVELGNDLESVAGALATYAGVGRRYDQRGIVNDVILIDDYAHHPTELAAVLSAVSGTVPGRVWAVFQPHLYSRTERFSSEFGEALSLADVAVVTDVYGAREEPVPGVTGEAVADAVHASGGDVHYVPHRFDLAGFIAPRVRSGDMVISLGAGDITLLHSELAPILSGNA